MDSIKSNAKAHLGISMALFGFWFVEHKVGLLVIAILFLVSSFLMFCSLKFRMRWLKKAGETLASFHVSHLILFLGLVGLVMILIQTGYLVAGIVLLYIAYVFLGLSIGRDLGDVFRSIRHKLRRRKAN